MDNRFSLVAIAALLVCGSAFAGYAQVVPPPNWTTSAGAAMYQAASNDVSFTGGIRGAAGVVNVGGRAVAIPAAYRFAANAGQIAARAAFLNPAWFLGAAALGTAYTFYKNGGFQVTDNSPFWTVVREGIACQSGCYEYYAVGVNGAPASGWNKYYTPEQAAGVAASKYVNPPWYVSVVSCTITQCLYRTTNQTTGTSFTGYSAVSRQAIPPYDTSTVTPATEEEFLNHHQNRVLPIGVPQQLPVPLPIEEVPILNPSPGDDPVPQPMRVPMGEPVPVPNTNPQQWKTPVVDLVPKPLTPWVVDLQPKDITKDSAAPLPDAEPVPVTPPAGQEEAPVTPDLCEKNPEILACQKVGLGSLEPSVITSTDKALAITKDTGWGPENGTCPAPKTAVVMGVQLSLPFTMLCDFAAGIRPLLIGFAWLSAALTFIGFGRKD